MYRAAVFMVADAIMKPTMPKSRETTICQLRSPTASECLIVFRKPLNNTVAMENLPRYSKCNQCGKNPRRCTKQQRNGWVVAQSSGRRVRGSRQKVNKTQTW